MECRTLFINMALDVSEDSPFLIHGFLFVSIEQLAARNVVMPCRLSLTRPRDNDIDCTASSVYPYSNEVWSVVHFL